MKKKEFPWIWVGGAAAVGLFLYFNSQSSSSGGSSTPQPTPGPGPAPGPTPGPGPIPGVPPVGTGQPSKFGLKLVETATKDLGLKETSYNSSPRIDEMLANVGQKPGVAWCAAAVSTWVKETAAALGVAPPIEGSASARMIGAELSDKSNLAVGWLTPADVQQNPELIQPGMVFILSRGKDPALGHTGVVTSVVGPARTYQTIEGNSGPNQDSVAVKTRGIDDASFLGVGMFFDVQPSIAA